MLSNNATAHVLKTFHKGMIVTGIWHKEAYCIHRQIGKGAIGTVYLVEQLSTSQFCAMKVADSMQAIAAEYTRLADIHKEVRSRHFGPLLYELDDIDAGLVRLHFYTMEYIEGVTFNNAITKSSPRQSLQYVTQLLIHLQCLHDRNLIFSDIKPENILIESKKQLVRVVDFGGVVPVGRMIKQYSVIYDRSSWRMGSRKSDKQYDIFAVGILLLQIFVSQNDLIKAQKKARPMFVLYGIIHRKLASVELKRICIKAISGKYQSANNMHTDIELLLSKKVINHYKLDYVFWASFTFMIGSILYVMNQTFKW